jgi:hypothetical protein
LVGKGRVMARTVLDVTADTKAYAKTHGAQYDRKTREWYIEGDVPPELENLLAKDPNPVFEDAQPGHNKSRVTEFLKGGALPVPPPAPARVAIQDDDPRLARWKEITELAARECGGVQQAGRWLNLGKLALRGRTPLEAMTTEEGCAAVERLLRELNT